ncbi:hypothetical protein HF909_18415 (plasmid) [Ralstonia pseudosolanacearum]|uniref:Uncharacterized protein n=1 Tax=Ralstonia solanacearum TaxID=305 RepID=A0AA92QD20_RALSL|nr:hypothetical protein [Ralstonia pseudosolanacearum]QOK98459.1 hypothetical protein HF909_18415 [Ralstonia pseudosolanacearum]
MRDINLLALVVCIAGSLYVYKYYPRDSATTQLALPSVTPKAETRAQPTPTAPQAAPRPQPDIATTPQQPAAQPTQQPGIDPWTAELARQADARIARQRQEYAVQEQQAAQAQAAQATTAASTCVALRQEKEWVLTAQRHGGTAQWMNYLNDRFHTVSDALYRNRC